MFKKSQFFVLDKCGESKLAKNTALANSINEMVSFKH